VIRRDRCRVRVGGGVFGGGAFGVLYCLCRGLGCVWGVGGCARHGWVGVIVDAWGPVGSLMWGVVVVGGLCCGLGFGGGGVLFVWGGVGDRALAGVHAGCFLAVITCRGVIRVYHGGRVRVGSGCGWFVFLCVVGAELKGGGVRLWVGVGGLHRMDWRAAESVGTGRDLIIQVDGFGGLWCLGVGGGGGFVGSLVWCVRFRVCLGGWFVCDLVVGEPFLRDFWV